jgi:hypothetical protein
MPGVGHFGLGALNRDIRFTAMNRHRQLGRSGPKSAAYSISSSERAGNVQLCKFWAKQSTRLDQRMQSLDRGLAALDRNK